MSIHSNTLKWVSKCRYVYLGVYFTSGRTFRCSYNSAKSSFFRAFNAIHSKVGYTASEETVITLLRFKYLPILWNTPESCPLLARDQSSLAFTTKRIYENISNKFIGWYIAECQRNFNFLSVQRQLTICTATLLQAFAASDKSSLLIVRECCS